MYLDRIYSLCVWGGGGGVGGGWWVVEINISILDQVCLLSVLFYFHTNSCPKKCTGQVFIYRDYEPIVNTMVNDVVIVFFVLLAENIAYIFVRQLYVMIIIIIIIMMIHFW